MVDDARKTVSEDSFVDNSYTNDSSDSGVRDILDIKHIHKVKMNDQVEKLVLGTVVKAEHQNEYSGDSFSHADSVYCTDGHKQRKHKSKKKKSRKSTKPDVLSDDEKMDIFDSVVSISSHKHKKKKRSRKSVPLSDVEETDVLDGDNLEYSALEDSHQHNRTKKSKFPKPDTLSDVTGWVLEADSLDYNDPQSLNETVNSHKSKKKKRKLKKSDTLSAVEEVDVLDRGTSIDSHKHGEKSRKFVQSDMVPDVEEASCVHNSVVVNSHKQKVAKKFDTFFQSNNLSDVVGWVLASDSLSNNDSQSLDPAMSSQKSKKGSKRSAQSDVWSDLQSVPDSVSCSKRKKKSSKMRNSDNLADGTNLALESDSQNYNDMQPLVDSEKSHKDKKKSSTLTLSDTLSSIEETNVLDCDTPVGSHKHKRTKKNKKIAESETLPGVEETSSVDDIAMMNSQKQQEAQTLDTFFQSGILSDVPDLEQDVESTTSNVSQLMCIPDSLNDSVSSLKNKKKSRKLTKSDTLSGGPDLAQEADILDYNHLHSSNDSVTSSSSKKKSRKQTKADALTSGTDLAQEADILDYNHLHSSNDSITSPSSKKKSRKQTKADILSGGTDLAQEADIPDSLNSQSPIDSVSSLKNKKKSRKLTKSDTLSSGTDLAQEADILDHSNSQSLNDSVISPKSKKKSRKRTNSGTFSDDFPTDFVQTPENLDYNDSQSLISSKSKKGQSVLAQSEPLWSIEEYCSGLQLLPVPAVVSQHKGKTKKRSSKSPGSDDLSVGSHVPDKFNIPSPWRKNRPVKREQPEPSEGHEDNSALSANSQSQLFVSLDFQTPNQKRRSKSTGKLDVKKEHGEEQEQEKEPQGARTKGSESMSTNGDMFRGHRCVPTPPADDDKELVEMLTDVIDDDKKFADILHAYEKNISATRYRKTKKILQAKRLLTNTLKWSPQEDEQLKKNWESFQRIYPAADAEVFLNCKNVDDKDNKDHVRGVIKETDFYVKLGVNIRRHLCQIYKRARLILIQRPYRPERGDDGELTTLQETYGNKWAKIARLMRTTEHLVEYRLKAEKKGTKKGVWSDTEDELLTEAVRETADDRYLELDHPQISWPKIAEKVPGRNTDQCYSHWFGVIQPRLKMQLAGESPRIHKYSHACATMFSSRQLIDSIDSLGVDSASDINWTRVQELINKNVPVAVLRSRWQHLKHTLPDYKEKTFTQIMENLRQRKAAKHE